MTWRIGILEVLGGRHSGVHMYCIGGRRLDCILSDMYRIPYGTQQKRVHFSLSNGWLCALSTHLSGCLLIAGDDACPNHVGWNTRQASSGGKSLTWLHAVQGRCYHALFRAEVTIAAATGWTAQSRLLCDCTRGWEGLIGRGGWMDR